jgi:heptaprenyl diphosphate synthase
MKSTHKATKHLVLLGLYTAIALILFLVEAQLPSPALSIPGMKLGLSNLVTLFLLTCGSKRDAILVLLARILLGSFFAGQMTALLYALSGGLLSFGMMLLCSVLLHRKRIWFTGMVGGISHNLGQILAAWILLQTTAVFSYLPVLVLCGMATGLFNGVVAGFFCKHFQNIHTV